MSDTILKYSQYSISVGTVPKKYEISKHIEELLNNPITKHEFHKENDIITKFDAITAELIVQKNEKDAFDRVNNNVESTNILVSNKKVIESIDPKEHMTASSSLVINEDLISFKENEIIEQKLLIQEKPTQDSIINDMMNQTKQEKDVCYFYLESANWDLNNAIELLKSMEAR